MRMGLRMKFKKLYCLDKPLKRYYHQKNGAAMAMVVVIVTVLIILGAIFSRFALLNYEMSTIIAYGDAAYFGAEAAAEKWYIILREILRAPETKLIGLDFPNDYGKEREYVLNVLERIRVYGNTEEKYHKKLEDDLEDFLKGKFIPEIKINGPQNRIIEATFGRFEVYHATRVFITSDEASKFGLINENQYAIKAKVGFLIVGDVKNESGKTITANKRIYVEKELYIPYYEKIQVLGSMYSVGDVIVIGDGGSGNNVANVYGDIYSFGTYPKEIRRPEQWAYGGVMARQNAKLNVMGNVYTRSFLRAGDYVVGTVPGWKDLIDNSEIRVTRDVFAQGIQTFSKGSRIYIYGSAFTLDDVEINAEDSIIGINGNFVGLSTGLKADTSTRNHDESSAILNSGQLHYTLDNQRLKSRIVINRDIIVPGTGWKINNLGVAEFPIESAGLIYPIDNMNALVSQDVPAYRHEHKFDPQGIGLVGYEGFLYRDSIQDTDGNNVQNLMNGYTNIIQAFPPVNTGGVMDINNGSINSWISNITNTINSNGYGNALAGKIQSLSGFAASIVGANDSIYWNNDYHPKKPTGHNPSNNQFPVSDFNYLENFSLDGFLPSDINLAYRHQGSLGEEGIDLFADETDMDFNVEVDRDLFLNPDVNILENHPTTQNVKKFWQHYWKPWNISNWEAYKNTALEYTTGVNVPPITSFIDFYDIMIKLDTSRLNGLKNLIEQRLNRIAYRSYPDDNSPNYWQVGVNDDLNLTFERIKILKDRGTPYIDYIDAQTRQPGEAIYSNLISGFDKDDEEKYYLLANEQSNLDIVINDVFRGIIITKGRVILTKGAKVYGTIFATGRYSNTDEGTFEGTLEEPNGGNLNAIDFFGPGWQTSDLKNLHDGFLGGIVFDLRRNGASSNDSPEINFYLGQQNDPRFNTIFSVQKARFELLEKFREKNVELHQIF